MNVRLGFDYIYYLLEAIFQNQQTIFGIITREVSIRFHFLAFLKIYLIAYANDHYFIHQDYLWLNETHPIEKISSAFTMSLTQTRVLVQMAAFYNLDINFKCIAFTALKFHFFHLPLYRTRNLHSIVYSVMYYSRLCY